MKRFASRLLALPLLLVVALQVLTFVVPARVAAQDAVLNCSTANGGDDSFLGLPTWHRGLNLDDNQGIRDALMGDNPCANPVVIVSLNLLDATLRIAGVVAVVFVVIGGFKYTLSDGSPDKATEARKTIVNALIGAAIAMMGATIITVIVNRL